MVKTELIKKQAENINSAARFLGCVGMNAEKIPEIMAQILGIIQASAEIIKECEEDG